MADEVLKDLVLKNVKEDLEINDDVQDTVLIQLIRKVMDHFKLVYRQPTIDDRFSFIIEDCTIKRYNRRKAEGASSVSVEGHSVTYEDKYEFDQYHAILSAEFGTDNSNKVTPGRVMWF